jgi:hypothetical protein
MPGLVTLRPATLHPVRLAPATLHPVTLRPATLHPVRLASVTLHPVTLHPATLAPVRALRKLVGGHRSRTGCRRRPPRRSGLRVASASLQPPELRGMAPLRSPGRRQPLRRPDTLRSRPPPDRLCRVPECPSRAGRSPSGEVASAAAAAPTVTAARTNRIRPGRSIRAGSGSGRRRLPGRVTRSRKTWRTRRGRSGCGGPVRTRPGSPRTAPGRSTPVGSRRPDRTYPVPVSRVPSSALGRTPVAGRRLPTGLRPPDGRPEHRRGRGRRRLGRGHRPSSAPLDRPPRSRRHVPRLSSPGRSRLPPGKPQRRQ